MCLLVSILTYNTSSQTLWLIPFLSIHSYHLTKSSCHWQAQETDINIKTNTIIHALLTWQVLKVPLGPKATTVGLGETQTKPARNLEVRSRVKTWLSAWSFASAPTLIAVVIIRNLPAHCDPCFPICRMRLKYQIKAKTCVHNTGHISYGAEGGSYVVQLLQKHLKASSLSLNSK